MRISISDEIGSTAQSSGTKYLKYLLYALVFAPLLGKITTLHIVGKTPNLFYSDMLVALTCAAFLAFAWRDGELKIKTSGLEVPILLFLFSATITLPLAIDPLRAIAQYKTVVFSFAVFFLTVNLVESRREAEWLLRCLALFGGILALYIFVHVALRGVSWETLGSNKDLVRVSWGKNNYLASFFALLIPVSIGLAGYEGRWLGRAGFAAVAVMQFLALILTASRGGLVSLIGGILFVIIFYLPKRDKFKYIIGLGAVILIMALIIPGRFLYYSFYNRFVNILDSANRQRLALWTDALRLFIGNPMGVGFGNIGFYHNRAGIFSSTSHNLYLQTLAEVGVIGFIFLNYIFILIFREVHVILKSTDGRGRFLLINCLAGYVAIMLDNLYEPSFWGVQFATVFWILVGIFLTFKRYFEAG
ncbi:MAG: O-antigen ligase family protein [bacterium]